MIGSVFKIRFLAIPYLGGRIRHGSAFMNCNIQIDKYPDFTYFLCRTHKVLRSSLYTPDGITLNEKDCKDWLKDENHLIKDSK